MLAFLNAFLHVSIAVVDLLQELTDIDTLHESEEGAEVLIDALVSSTVQPSPVGTRLVPERAWPVTLDSLVTTAPDPLF